MKVYNACLNGHSISNNPYTKIGLINKKAYYKPQIDEFFRNNTITFSAKIPSISTPTIEDIINKVSHEDVLRHNILKLAIFKIPCPVCGHIMLDAESFNAFQSKVMSANNSAKLLACIREYKEYLHPVEEKVYELFRTRCKNNPNLSFIDILKENLPEAENKLIHEQMKIFANIGLLSRNLHSDKRLKVQQLIQEAFSKILEPGETSTFSRRVFINKLKSIFSDEPLLHKDGYKATLFCRESVLSLLKEATKLPTAYNNVNAFIVKYAKRDYKDCNPNKKIALRLLSNSLATVEHITAKKNNGLTSPANLALECACDNNRKGHVYIVEQISENPMMVIHYPKYIRRLCELHNEGKVEKSYIKQHNKTFEKASDGLLNASEELATLRWEGKKQSITSNEKLKVAPKTDNPERKEVRGRYSTGNFRSHKVYSGRRK